MRSERAVSNDRAVDLLAGWPAPGAPSRMPAPMPLVAGRAASITRWAFYLYVAWIPLEYPDRTLPFDFGTLMGALFLATTAFSLRTCYSRIPAPVALYGVFVYAWVASYVVNGGQYGDIVQTGFLRLVLLVLVFWASINLLRDQQVVRTTLLILIASCVIVALLQVTRIADMQGSDYMDGVRRTTVLGQNPNRTGRFYAGAALAAIGVAFAARGLGGRMRLTMLTVVALLVVGLVQGGSRGAMLTFVAALAPFALAAPSFGARVRNGLIALLVSGALGWMALQSPLMQERLALAQSGNLAGRERIFPEALAMASERPLLGWGPINAYYQLGSRLAQPGHERRDTHNLVLELFTTTGAAGGVPALLALLLCVRAAWRARQGPLGPLPLALMAQVVVGNMSGNFLVFKLYWLFQALALASVSLPGQRLGRTQR